MTAHSSILAWRIPWTRSLPGYRAQGRRVGRNSACTYVYTHTFFFILHYGDRIQKIVLNAVFSRTLLFIHSIYKSLQLLPPSHLATTHLFYISVSLFHRQLHLFILDFTYSNIVGYFCLSLAYFTYCVNVQVQACAANGIISFLWLSTIPLYIYLKKFLYPFICQWTYRFFPMSWLLGIVLL